MGVLVLIAFDWMLHGVANRIVEFSISSNHMRIPEERLIADFGRFFFGPGKKLRLFFTGQ